jgi:hypothetical protein
MLGEANAAVSTQADAVRSIKASLQEGKVEKVMHTRIAEAGNHCLLSALTLQKYR